MMQNLSVALIGAGPRSLSVLERLCVFYGENQPDWELDVHMIDPREPGQGAHSARQPAHLLTNTVAGQITLFTDESVRDAGPIRPGPSLLEWARSAGYRSVGGHVVKAHHDGRALQESDYVPRYILGEYMTFVYDTVVRDAPVGIKITHHRRPAENIDANPNGSYLIELSGWRKIYSYCVVIATEHFGNVISKTDAFYRSKIDEGLSANSLLGYFSSVDPIGVLETISEDARVYVEGMGLTAYDVVTELTAGRGGRFVEGEPGHFRYHASGREPHLILASRQGLPFSARAVNEKGLAGLYRPHFFTKPLIDRLRSESHDLYGTRQLDYVRDVWPILLKEMCFVYDSATSSVPIEPDRYEPSEDTRSEIARIMSPFDGVAFANYSDFVETVCDWIERDLQDAAAGNVSNANKATSDVLRDLRDHIRYAVDYAGLTEESHRYFLSHVMPVMYRISAGAPRERNRELLALIAAGVVSLAPGPGPSVTYDDAAARFVIRSTRLDQEIRVAADVVIRARIDCAVMPETVESPLLRNLFAHGFVRPFCNGGFLPGGIDVDRNQNVVDGSGRTLKDIWALGIVTEGANFCTYVPSRYFVNSRFLQFSGRCAGQIYEVLSEKASLAVS